MTDQPVPARATLLADVPHGFLDRRGGVSTGAIEGLDMGMRGAEPTTALIENRRRAIAAVLPGATLVTVRQVHSADAVTVTAPLAGERPAADALVTDRPGLLLGVLTADCAPVLLADLGAGVVGAAHAGWKGALAGITDAALAAMERLGAVRDRVVAAVGPCIARASYEVDDAYVRRFEAADPANERFFVAGRPGHHRFDLAAYVMARLAAAGVPRIETLDLDTYADPSRFFSYRHATHAGAPDYGRQISLIGLGA